MIINTIRKGLLCAVTLALVLASVPLTNANANWNGQFTLSSATYSKGEAGGTVSITIKLSGSRIGKKPWSAQVNYATSNGTAVSGSDYTTTSGSRSFKKAGSWTFTIPITTDSIPEGNETFIVSLLSPTNGATLGTPSSAVVTIVDDDTAGISVTPSSGLNVTEAGGTATFAVYLMKQPNANVSIGLSSSDTTEGTVSPSSLTFTSVNWNLAQTVTVLGLNDFLDDGDIAFTIITTAATSTDSGYNGMNASDVAITNIDNDTAGIMVTPTSGVSVSEGGGATTFTVVLTSQPGANVSLGLSSSDTTEGTVLPTTLSFTAVNWNVAQSVTVTGVDDLDIDGNAVFKIITASANSTDSNYNGLNASDVEVVNIDDDVAGITVISMNDLYVTEAGGTATFTIVLNRQPSDDVSIALSSSDTTEGTITPDSLKFTSSNWATAQTVTITGVDDFVDDGDIAFMIITATATSADANYNAIDASDVSVTNEDDDTAGITITPTGSLIVTEAGGTATLTVVLTSQPGADVSIALSSSDTTEGTVSSGTLTFTSTDWASPQEITVSGVDDTDVDGNVDFEIVTGTASSADNAYNGMNAADVLITNIDDDNAPPTASPDTYSTIWRSPITVNDVSGVLSNDSDAEDDPLTAELVLGPSVEEGTLIINDDGSFTFTPAETITGNATFTYRAFDGLNYSDPVTVTIQVIAMHLYLPLTRK